MLSYYLHPELHSCISGTHSNSSEAAKLSFLSLLCCRTGGEIHVVFILLFYGEKISIALFISFLISPNDY